MTISDSYIEGQKIEDNPQGTLVDPNGIFSK